MPINRGSIAHRNVALIFKNSGKTATSFSCSCYFNAIAQNGINSNFPFQKIFEKAIIYQNTTSFHGNLIADIDSAFIMKNARERLTTDMNTMFSRLINFKDT